MKFNRNFIVLAVTLLFLSTTAFAHRDHSWGNYHWARTTNPFLVKLGDNVNGTWDGHLVDANGDWNSSSVINTTIVAGGTRPKRCAITSGRVEVCNERYGNTGWYGVAGISINGSHITGSYVKLNDSYAMSEPLKDLVTCQEVGHAFGLGHQDETFGNANLGTCMDYTNDADGGGAYGPSNTEPNAHDFAQLETIYNSHLDNFNSYSMIVPEFIAFQDFRTPESWGRAVRFNREGQAIAFEKDFGNGNKVITHIYPVPGDRRYHPEKHDDH
jgi:hypothetical protein